jgi:hypothetical protein
MFSAGVRRMGLPRFGLFVSSQSLSPFTVGVFGAAWKG